MEPTYRSEPEYLDGVVEAQHFRVMRTTLKLADCKNIGSSEWARVKFLKVLSQLGP